MANPNAPVGYSAAEIAVRLMELADALAANKAGLVAYGITETDAVGELPEITVYLKIKGYRRRG